MHSNLLNATALLNTGPVFIAIIDWGILRKKVGVSTWIGTLVSFVGALLILQPDEGIFSLLSLIGLFAGISQGASQVVFGMQSERAEKPHVSILHLFFLCAFLSLLPFLFFRFETGNSMNFSSWDLGIIFVLGTASIVNQLFRAEAYAHGTPSRLSPYLYFAVLLAGVWDWAVFGLVPNWISIIGAALVVTGGLLKILLRTGFYLNLDQIVLAFDLAPFFYHLRSERRRIFPYVSKSEKDHDSQLRMVIAHFDRIIWRKGESAEPDILRHVRFAGRIDVCLIENFCRARLADDLVLQGEIIG